ncbi:coiled-coil domain-containing protein 73 isoform X1 [Pogona vitticeps]
MDEGLNEETSTYNLQNSSEALLCIQRLDFKTSLLEAIEELRMRRGSEISYEEQIHKLVVEKQELEWQKEALQQQKEVLNRQHTEAMAAFKKQFQARMFAMEEEKGKFLLAKEAKERETEGLKETLKKLQISKYTLQKKLNEMEQKLQLHLLAKEDQQKNMNEFEKCHATITCQFGILRGSHERLEQNVMEAVQLNKKLQDVNKRQASEIDNLKKELKEVTAKMIRSNVTCQHRVGEENLKRTAREQELQELRQKNAMETELNTKITEENTQLKEEKEELIASLQHIQQLLCRQIETNTRMEMELNKLKEEYQTLERDNELQREKAKENEEKFLILQNEYNKAQATWKSEARDLPIEYEMHTGSKESKYTQTTLKVSNNLAQEENGIKDALPASFNADVKLTAQNSAYMCVWEDNSVSTEGLELLENYVCEDETVHPFNEQEREGSLGKTNFIESGRSTESYISEYKETMTKGKEVEKILLESIEDSENSVPNQNADYDRRLSKPPDRVVTNEMVSEIQASINNTLHEVVSSTSGVLSKDSKLQDVINEKTVNSSTETESVLSQITMNEKGAQHESLDKGTYICNAKQTSQNHSTSKQKNTPLGEVHSDNSSTNNTCSEQVNSFNTSENIIPLHASFCKNSGINPHITNDSISKSPLVKNLNACEKNSCKDINKITSKCSNKNSSILREMGTKTAEISCLYTENVHASQSAGLKDNHITREKQRDFHTSKTTSEEFVVVAEQENISLNEKEEPLRGTIRGEISTKEDIEELCSLPIKTTEDFINRSVRPCCQLGTMGEKAKKIAVELNLPRVCQGEIQTLCASTSEMASFLKENLLLQEINDSQNSKGSVQTMNLHTAVKEETLASTHYNRASDTLNSGSINVDPKINPSEEWNAMPKTFSDPSFPTEHVTTACQLGSQQKFSQMPSEISGTILNESSNNPEETGWNLQNVFIKTQLSNTEKFLSSERLCQPRKRKYEEDSEKAMTADKSVK